VAVAGGAAYLGFVFYPPSPRAVTPREAAGCVPGFPRAWPEWASLSMLMMRVIEAALALAPLDILQFHGSEPPERVGEVRCRFGLPVMKAVAIARLQDVLGAARYEDVADLLLFDAKPPRRPDALPGGNGLAFDWGLIADRSWRRPWMLSGGLTPEGAARGGPYFRCGGGRCFLRRREPFRSEGSGQDSRLPRRRSRALIHHGDTEDTEGGSPFFSVLSVSPWCIFASREDRRCKFRTPSAAVRTNAAISAFMAGALSPRP